MSKFYRARRAPYQASLRIDRATEFTDQLLTWLLEIILVASFVSDRWTRDIQASEDQMLIAYFGVQKEAKSSRPAKNGLTGSLSEPASERTSTATSF